MKQRCSRLWEVDVQREGRLGIGDEESFVRHRRTCDECRERFFEDERLQELGRSIAVAEPNELAARRMRSTILHRSATTSPAKSRTQMILTAAALGCLSMATVATRAYFPPRTSPDVLSRAEVESTVTPGPGAEWQREREGNVERIRIGEGTVTLEVRHQTPARRFFVETPDAEIEVRGTRFEVIVSAHQTRRVHVFEGVVALRRRGEAERRLGANETWEESGAGATNGSVTVNSFPRTPPPTAKVIAPHQDGDVSDALESEYRRAMDLYSSGQYDRAAHDFRAFTLRHPSASESEDATFLEAVSLARSSRGDDAAMAAERFLSRYPASFHAKDAAIIVARAARVRGDCVKARKVLAQWSGPNATTDVTNALGTCMTESTP